MTPSLPLGYETLLKGSLRTPALLEDSSERHLITIAPTGAGKGVSCIIPALLSWSGPAVVIDPKGENYAVTARYRASMGQRIYVIDPFAVTSVAVTDRLNPIDLLTLPGSAASDDAACLVALLMNGSMTVRGDPFWDERAGALLAGALTHILAGDKKCASVGMLFERLNDTYENLVAFGRTLMASERPDVRAAGAALDPSLSSKTGASITATAQSHLSFLRNATVASTLGSSTIPIEDIVSGAPLTIYLVLPPDKLPSHSKALRLWLGTIMMALARRRSRPASATLLLLDEAAQLGALDELRTALTLMRGYGVKVWSFWQDMSQIRRLYPKDWQSLVNNCGVQQYFGAVSPFAALEIEAYLAGQAPRPIYGMPDEQMVLLTARAAPRLLNRLNYLTDARLAKRAQPNPYFSGSAPPSAEIIPFAR